MNIPLKTLSNSCYSCYTKNNSCYNRCYSCYYGARALA